MRKIINILALLMIMCHLWSKGAEAQLTDYFNFNNLSNGDLNNQSGWTNEWNSLIVQDSEVYAGKAIRNHSDYAGLAYQEFPTEAKNEDEVSFVFKIDNNYYADMQEIVGIYNGIGEVNLVNIRFANNYDDYSNTLLAFTADYPQGLSLGQVTQGVWNQLTISWRQKDARLRVKYNSFLSPWISSSSMWDSQSQLGVRVHLPGAENYGNFYFDTLHLDGQASSTTMQSLNDVQITDDQITTIDYIAY